MGKHHISVGVGHAQGRYRACRAWFVGPGERCPKCQEKLRERKRRKPR